MPTQKPSPWRLLASRSPLPRPLHLDMGVPSMEQIEAAQANPELELAQAAQKPITERGS